MRLMHTRAPISPAVGACLAPHDSRRAGAMIDLLHAGRATGGPARPLTAVALPPALRLVGQAGASLGRARVADFRIGLSRRLPPSLRPRGR